MSKKAILTALKRKGLEASTIEFNSQPTPHGSMPGWDINLTEECEIRVSEQASGIDFEPDCETAVEVLAWIETLPDLSINETRK